MRELNLKLQEKCGIYIITNLINGHRYIGSSNDLYSRLKRHRWELRNNDHVNAHLQNAWNKYGEDNFEYGILEYCSVDNKLKRENFYVNLLKPEYNINGVDLSSMDKHSEETKSKISESIKKSYESGKLKEHLDKSMRRSIPCYIYDINTWKKVKDCSNFAEADEFLNQPQSVRTDLLGNRIFKNQYVILDKIVSSFDLKNFVCEHLLKYIAKNIKRDTYLICDDGEIHYFRTIQSLINYTKCSSKSTISKHSDATIDKPYIIPNTNFKVYFSDVFIPYSRDVEESTLELSNNIGEHKENPEITEESNESSASYSVETETEQSE